MPNLPSNILTINDSNYRNFVGPQVVGGELKSFGYQGMWEPGCREPKTFADLKGVPLMPKDERLDRAREAERNGTRHFDLAVDMGLPCLDQNGTNYCWINAPVYCCEYLRLVETGQVVSYSPASAGARIKKFRNIGGWGSQGLDWMIDNGVNYTDDWPDNAINRSYDTAANRENAKRHIVLEYYRLDGWDETASCIAAKIPVAVGYNWWSHEVTAVDLIPNSSEDLLIRNSWSMSWGEKGFGKLQGSRKVPNDAVAITAMLAM